MKNLFIAFFLLFHLSVVGQHDMKMPDSATVVGFPWYGNNDYLVNYLTQRGFYASPQLRVDCPFARYYVPVKLHIYRDDAGNAGTNIDQVTAELIFDGMNTIFDNAGTSIQFYIDDVEFKNDENYRTGIENEIDTYNLFDNEQDAGVINIHMVRDGPTGGFAFGAYLGIVPWNCWINTNRGVNEVTSTLAHEMGHVLGLLHTHHPGRNYFALLMDLDSENGDTPNRICYQEVVSRTSKNKWGDGCWFGSSGKVKSEINGDFLRDTNADPGLSTEEDASGTILKEVTDMTASPSCEYINHSFGNRYDEDYKGVAWDPPVNNIMAYTARSCRTEFSDMQIGVMWDALEEDFRFHFEGQFTGNDGYLCTGGKTITLVNEPPFELQWSVAPTNLIHSSTRSGTGSSAFIRAASASSTGWATITFFQVEDCNFFNTTVQVRVGKPVFDSGHVTGASSLTIGSSSVYYSPSADHKDYYQWSFPNGGFTVLSGQATTSARIKATGSTGMKTIQLRAYNECGYRYKYIHVNVNSSSGGGGGDPCVSALSIAPNPVVGSNIVARVILPGGGDPPCLPTDILQVQTDGSSLMSSARSGQSNTSKEKEGTIYVTNHVGEVVLKKKQKGEEVELNLNRIKKGVYTLHYLYKGDEHLTTRFIKDK